MWMLTRLPRYEKPWCIGMGGGDLEYAADAFLIVELPGELLARLRNARAAL